MLFKKLLHIVLLLLYSIRFSYYIHKITFLIFRYDSHVLRVSDCKEEFDTHLLEYEINPEARAMFQDSNHLPLQEIVETSDPFGSNNSNEELATINEIRHERFAKISQKLFGSMEVEAAYQYFLKFREEALGDEDTETAFFTFLEQTDFSVVTISDQILEEVSELQDVVAGKNIFQIANNFKNQIGRLILPYSEQLVIYLHRSAGIEKDKAVDITKSFYYFLRTNVQQLIMSDQRIHEARIGLIDMLDNVRWANGDSVQFEPAITMDMEDGGKKILYSAKLTYKVKGSSDLRTVDLTNFIPGETIYFEGTRGSIVMASSDYEDTKITAGAVNRELSNVLKPHIVALDVDRLPFETKAISTIFHEIGHVYLLPYEPTLLPAQRRGIMRLLDKMQEEKLPQIQGIEIYKREMQRTIQEIYDYAEEIQSNMDTTVETVKRDSNWTPLSEANIDYKTVAKIISLNLLSDDMQVPDITEDFIESLSETQDFLAQVRRFKDSMRRTERGIGNQTKRRKTLIKEFADVYKITNIFQERNARAFAVRNIRALGMANVNPQDVLSEQIESLAFHAKQQDDFRYTEITRNARLESL